MRPTDPAQRYYYIHFNIAAYAFHSLHACQDCTCNIFFAVHSLISFRTSSLIIFFSDQRLPAILYCFLVLFHVQL